MSEHQWSKFLHYVRKIFALEQTGKSAPYRLLILTLGSIFIAEILIHNLVHNLVPLSKTYESFLSAIISTGIIFPILYTLAYRPLLTHIRLRKQVEQTLRENEKYYRAIVEDQTEIICRISPEGKLTFVNDACSRYFGFERESLIDQPFTGLFLDEDQGMVKTRIGELSRHDPVVHLEMQIKRPSGETRWMLWTIRALLNDWGVPGSYQAVGRDTTERKNALFALQAARDDLEQQVHIRTAELAKSNDSLIAEVASRRQTEATLRERETSLQFVISQMPAILWSTDKDLRFSSLLGAGITALDLNPEQLLGTSLLDYIKPDKLDDPIIAAHQQALQGITTAFKIKVGETELQNYVEPFRNLQGEIIGCIGVSLDITAHKKAEDQIKLQYSTLEAAANGILITDPSGNIQWCNQAISKMTGYSTEELTGQNIRLLKSGSHTPAEYQNLWETVLAGNVWTGEMVNRRKDGRLYTEEQTITPVLDPSGAIRNFIAIKQDITNKKRVEKDLKRRNWELSLLHATGNVVGSSLDLVQVFSVLEKVLTEEPSLPAGNIFTYNPNHDRLHLEAAWKLPKEFLVHHKVLPITGSFLEQAIQDKKVILIEDLSLIPTEKTGGMDFSKTDLKGCLCLPLFAQGRVQGVMSLLSNNPDEFGATEKNFYQALANQIGAAIQNARSYKTELRARQTAETLRNASLTLTKTLDLEIVLQKLLDILRQMVSFDVGKVYLLEDDRHLGLKSLSGSETYPCDGPPGRLNIRDHPVLEELLNCNKSQLITSKPRNSSPEDENSNHSWMGIPVALEEKVIGVCALDKYSPGIFTEEDLRMAEAMVGQAAVAIQNAWLFEQVRSGRERLQSLSHRLVEVQESERRYIARELHDEASQALIYLIFGLDLLKRDADQPEAVIAGVAELEKMVSDVLDNLHQLAVNLRPASLDHLGLIPALRQYIEAVSDKHGLTVQFDSGGVTQRMPANIETALYRIVQEALNNTVRHAQATRVDVRLVQLNDRLIVIIEDNGIGFDPEAAAQSGRLGLFGVRERADMLDGCLEIDSIIGKGTKLTVEVPYVAADPNRG